MNQLFKDKNMFFRFVMITILVVSLFSIVTPTAAEEGTPPLPIYTGWIQGTGMHFELPESPYFPVTLDSSVTVSLTLSSVPEVVDLYIDPDVEAGSAQFTLGGFTANSLYYRYTDTGLDPVTFTTDANGKFTYTQDLSEGHHTWFRDRPSTYYLRNDATGGDCNDFGTWDMNTKTCTMTTDVYQSIFIIGNDITLDGNGFSSLSSDQYYAVMVANYNNTTVKNLTIESSGHGIHVFGGTNVTITNNTITGGWYGIIVNRVENVVITNNTIINADFYGIYSYFRYTSGTVTIGQNSIRNSTIGIMLYDGEELSATTITDNNVSDCGTGVAFSGLGIDSVMVFNTISNNNLGLSAFNRYGYPASVYNNNFIDNTYQISNYFGNVSFNQPAPVGGNFFSNYNTPDHGCNNFNGDSFCDAPYEFVSGIDYLPWTMQNGWLNQPPTVDAGGYYSSDEGSAIVLDTATASDPDQDPLIYNWSVDSDLCSFDDPSLLNPTVTCADNGSFTATLDVSDGTITVSSVASLTVNNVAPTLNVISLDKTLVPINTPINASADFTDPGSLDTHTAVWDWGDGTSTGTVIQDAGFGSVSDFHSYSIPGIYTIKLIVTDDDGSLSNESAYQYLVVYNPDGGFVSGAGWIDSPEGAYVADPSLSGKAIFGFVAKYQKGAIVPDGNARFIFNSGDLHFQSSSYQWLVVAGGRAQFKGQGTINGAGNYGFMLTAIDGQINSKDGVDKFRIKIWDMDNGDVIVYDNLVGGADNDDPTTELGGGSIVIH